MLLRYPCLILLTLPVLACGEATGPADLSGTYNAINTPIEISEGTTLHASEIRFMGSSTLERTDYFQTGRVEGETRSGRYALRGDRLTITYFADSPAEYSDEGVILDGLLRIPTALPQRAETAFPLLIYTRVPDLRE